MTCDVCVGDLRRLCFFLYLWGMKKWILCVAMLLSAVTAWGQSYRIVVDPGVPAPAAEVLCERFTQML